MTERKLNNTKLISGQVKPGNIESFYADPAKGKVKDIEVKEGQESRKARSYSLMIMKRLTFK